MTKFIWNQYLVFKRHVYHIADTHFPILDKLDSVDWVIVAILSTIIVKFILKNYYKPFYTEFYKNLKRNFIELLIKLPAWRNQINKEIEKTRNQIKGEFVEHGLKDLHNKVQEKPFTWKQIDDRLAEIEKVDSVVKKGGQITGAYYTSGEQWEEKIIQRCGKHLYYNLMHVDIMYGLRQMEAELISCFLDLLNGGENSCGTFTSGGTESILQSIISLRQFARQEKGIREPELIIANTAHCAFNKACFYFRIKCVIINVDARTDYVATAAMIKRKINSNTIGIVCSAGNYPHGLIEPIEEIAKVAKKYNVPIHVDCCLGGYSMIFGQEIGNKKVPLFDFRIPEVFCISIDPHKHGQAPKGASLVLFKNKKVKEAGIYVYNEWVGGLYGTVSLTGSRPSASMTGAWIATVLLGKEGMRKNARDIYNCVFAVKKGLKQIKEVTMIGDPILNVIAFQFKMGDHNNFQMSEALRFRGWKLQICQYPICLHMAVTLSNMKKMEETFVRDIQESIIDISKNPKKYGEGKMGQIYGSTAKVPDTLIIDKVMRAVISEFNHI